MRKGNKPSPIRNKVKVGRSFGNGLKQIGRSFGNRLKQKGRSLRNGRSRTIGFGLEVSPV